MQLTDVQKEAVRKWVAEGAGLSEIQRRLTQEFSLSMTYMDVRVLLIDLKLDLKEKAVKPVAKTPAKAAAPGAADVLEPELDDLASGGKRGAVRVEMDRIVKPGSIVSGTVRFSDGVTAKWALDQMGRLALDAGRPGYRPSEADLQGFQAEVSRELQKQGF